MPNQKLPFLSSKTEKKRAELTLAVIFVNDFPSYRKIPSNAAIQILPFRSCMMLRVIRSGPCELTMLVVSGVTLSFGRTVAFCASHNVQEAATSQANRCIFFAIFLLVVKILGKHTGFYFRYI